MRDRIVTGDARLALTIPPRHGKSELCSVWLVVWLLTMRPQSRIGLVTYGHQFSAKWGRRIRAIIREHGETLGLHINPEKDAANDFELLEGGSVLCTGVGGVLTGHGFDVMVVDDPYKNRADAESEVIRAGVLEWWQSTARSRLEPGASVIALMQRWREDDLVGWLMSDASGEEWELINLPAIAEDGDPIGREVGDALWPERYPGDALTAIKAGVGSYNWASQFQQRPNPAGGAVFQRRYFRYFAHGDGCYELTDEDGSVRRPLISDCWLFQTADTALKAKTQSDWTVCTTFAVTPDNDLLVLSVDRARLEVPDQLAWLYGVRERYPRLRYQGIEPKASGIGIIQQARRDGKPFRELGGAEVDKITRASAAAILYENGKVFHRAGAEWLDDLESELVAFPNGKHDDQVDTISYGGREIGTSELQLFMV